MRRLCRLLTDNLGKQFARIILSILIWIQTILTDNKNKDADQTVQIVLPGETFVVCK